MSSYYNNGPRIFTPSTLKTSTTFIPIESFGATGLSDLPPSPKALEAEAPDVINTCHRSRGSYLQQSHPRTYALLRRAEAAKTEEALAQTASSYRS